jgi:hypothetical protein
MKYNLLLTRNLGKLWTLEFPSEKLTTGTIHTADSMSFEAVCVFQDKMLKRIFGYKVRT